MYTIGQVARFLNVSRDTLKYYEDMGLVNPQKNNSNGYRLYSHYDIQDIIAINYYRELDIEIKKIQQIRKSKSVNDIAQLIEEKEQLVAKEIESKQYLLKQLKKVKEHSLKTTKHLGVFSIIDMPQFIVKGEITDVFTYEDYDVLKTHTDNSKKAVTLSKLMRIVSFDDEGIKGNRFVVVKEKESPDENTGEEVIAHKKCLYTIVDSEITMNNDNKISEIIRQASIENNCKLIGLSYVRIILTTYENGQERMFYDVYTPIV